METFDNDLQSIKAPFLIDVTDDGIVIFSRLLHPLNASVPIEVTVGGIDICVNNLQSIKELFPIDVTDNGIDIRVNLSHLRNNLSSILFFIDKQ